MTVRLSAGFGGEEDTALRYFRADIPARGLARFGWRCEVERLVVNGQTFDRRFIPWNERTEPGKPPAVMVLRTTNDLSMSAAEHEGLVDDVISARKMGQRIVLDLDDDLWHVPAWSPAARAVRDNDLRPVKGLPPAIDLPMLNELVGAVDAVSTSTRRVADAVTEANPAATVAVLANGADPANFFPHEPLEGRPLRVGWMGGASFHGAHLRTMLEALDVLHDAGAEFIHMGWVDETAREARRLYAEIHEHAPHLRIGHVDWLPYSELRQCLSLIDVGIIPRVMTDFNEGQSTSSGLAYALAGVAFIAAPSAEYRDLEAAGAGVTASSVDEWRARLEELLRDPDRRQAGVTRAHRVVAERHGLRRVGEDWHRFLSGLL